MWELSIDFTRLLDQMQMATASCPTQVKKKKTCNVFILPQRPSPMLFRHMIVKWGHTLVSVHIKNHSTSLLLMPCDMVNILLLHLDMKHLEITGVDIDLLEATLGRLIGVVDSKLEVLHLPTHFTAPCISLGRLRDIAEACPLLKSLHCVLSCLQFCPVSESDAYPLSHHLEVLSVENEQDELE